LSFHHNVDEGPPPDDFSPLFDFSPAPDPAPDYLADLPFAFPDDTDDGFILADPFCSATVSFDDDPCYAFSSDTTDPLHIRALCGDDPLLSELRSNPTQFYSLLKSDHLQFNAKTLRAHFDGGSMATTTDVLSALWHYRAFDPFDPVPPPLEVADHTSHSPVGFGFLNIPSSAPSGSTLVHCLFTPSLPATIVSPFAIGLQFNSRGYTCVSDFPSHTCSVTLHSMSPTVPDLSFPQVLVRGLLFSHPVLFPTVDQHSMPPPTALLASFESSPLPTLVRQLTRDHLRHLWHQRFGHIHSRRLAQAHQFATGVPAISKPGPLDNCPICIKAKLHKAARGVDSSRRATQCYQGLSVDFGFIVQNSSADSARVKRLSGLHRETCYCLLVDHFSGMLFGQCFASKAPPLEFLNSWLALYGLPTSTADCYVRFDLGGELGRCDDVVKLFTNAGYHVEPTAPDSSHQNGPGERPHRTIADGIRTMLAGASMPPKFWPYAFHHFIRLYNVTPHGSNSASPYEICSGSKPDLSSLCVFGCRVFALPARPR
jgi:hypothetical protein